MKCRSKGVLHSLLTASDGIRPAGTNEAQRLASVPQEERTLRPELRDRGCCDKPSSSAPGHVGPSCRLRRGSYTGTPYDRQCAGSAHRALLLRLLGMGAEWPAARRRCCNLHAAARRRCGPHPSGPIASARRRAGNLLRTPRTRVHRGSCLRARERGMGLAHHSAPPSHRTTAHRNTGRARPCSRGSATAEAR